MRKNECCQLNTLLMALTQTHFNNVHFFNARLTFCFVYFYSERLLQVNYDINAIYRDSIF